ncbi:hypothetical protein V2J09_021017 [Rumex salicifolius]
MEFEKRKAAAMAAMAATSPDKSPKGNIDAPILPLLKTLNLHPSFFTTSSCSGRISIFSHPIASTAAKKAKGGTWIFITHDPADPASVLRLLFPSKSESTQSSPDSDLVFRFEPLIIAVECKDVQSAQLLVSLAISCGFRESGITSVSGKRVMVAIRCSIRLEVPLGSNKELLVSKEYVRYLAELANAKMEANRKRTDGFLEALRRNGFTGSDIAGCDSDHDCLDGVSNTEQLDSSRSSGSSGIPDLGLAVNPIKIVGESLEKLFLWGHTSCISSNSCQKNILVYGGFGGLGRHARRSDCLLLDPLDGTLTILNTKGTPSPRLGHTCSLIGDLMFIIGGRADPVNILSDLWIFNTTTNEWKLVQCTGCAFPPRLHRHAAAVVGSKIYVYGGLYNDTIYSSMLVFDVENLHWEEVHAQGEWPCARHSHSLVACGSKLYLFGGYSGEKALGDLLSFDIHNGYWEKVKAEGRLPYPRFSHSMFTYKNCLGILGGCPVRQHCQELALFDTRLCCWIHVMLNSAGKDLFVRSSVNIIESDLIVIGGGASCYAFGTKFSEPVKINLNPLMTLVDTPKSAVLGGNHPPGRSEGIIETRNVGEIVKGESVELSDTVTHAGTNAKESIAPVDQMGQVSYWVLKLEKKYAKLGKDILKKFGWLDLGRKVYASNDGSHICFPVTMKFGANFQDTQSQSLVGFGEIRDMPKSLKSLNEVSSSVALSILLQCGAIKFADNVAEIWKGPRSPLESMKEAVACLIKENDLSAELLAELPTRWEKLGDIAVLPLSSFKDPVWNSISSLLWPAVAKCLSTRRLARQGRVAATGTRDSRLEILVGDNCWVEHRENGILYSFDATKCMFSWGNLSEKLRMACLVCKDEIIVDLFAGIGYFTLPFLVRANAKLVYACEWNPHAIEALQRNVEANGVADRCIVLEGDNRLTAPRGVANRVCLGLIPSSECSWLTAVRALRDEGGILHIHGNVKDTEESQWTNQVLESISQMAKSEGHHWDISLQHLERVKWYAPHIRHVVVDVRCSRLERERETSPKWRDTTKQNIQDYPCTPDVYFLAIIASKYFRQSKINRLQHGILLLARKQEVLRLKIPVHHAHEMAIVNNLNNGPANGRSSSLRVLSLCNNPIKQLTAHTELHYNMNRLPVFIGTLKIHHVGLPRQMLKNLNLSLDILLVVLAGVVAVVVAAAAAAAADGGGFDRCGRRRRRWAFLI